MNECNIKIFKKKTNWIETLYVCESHFKKHNVIRHFETIMKKDIIHRISYY